MNSSACTCDAVLEKECSANYMGGQEESENEIWVTYTPPVTTCEEPDEELVEDPVLATFLAVDVVAGFASCVVVTTTF